MYQLPIIVAMLLFPGLAALFLIPFASYMYHRYGRFPLGRAIVFYSFIYYIMALFFYIVLPLPTITANFCVVYHATATPQLHLFQFVDDITRETARDTLLEVLTNQAFLQVFLNVLLFVPLGVYLHYYYRRSFLLTIGIAFVTSLGLEFTQYTGFWHFYPCAYRLFDVDDLLLNTLGASIGAGLVLIARFLPSMQPKRVMTSHPVGIFRRLLAWITDAIVVSICVLLLMVIIFSLLIHYTSVAWVNPWVENYGSMVFYACVFVSAFMTFALIPLVWHGKTVGKHIMAITLMTFEGTKPQGKYILIRYLAFVFPATVLKLLQAIFSSNALLQNFSSLLSIFLWLLVIIYVLPIPSRFDHQSLGGLLSHTRNVVQNETNRHRLLFRPSDGS